MLAALKSLSEDSSICHLGVVILSIVFSHSHWDFPGSWYDGWDILLYTEHFSIILWDSGSYLSLPFQQTSSDCTPPHYYQMEMEVQVPHSASIWEKRFLITAGGWDSTDTTMAGEVGAPQFVTAPPLVRVAIYALHLAFVDGNSGGVGGSQIFVCAVGESVLLCGPFPGPLAGKSRFFLRIFFFFVCTH